MKEKRSRKNSDFGLLGRFALDYDESQKKELDFQLS
jgi:hypothetical protein